MAAQPGRAETVWHGTERASRRDQGLTMPHVLIAGGGVAALEAALALRALAPDPVDVELLGPEPHFWYRPLSVAEPFGLGEARHYELSTLAADAGARFTLGELQGVDVAAHEARTSVGAIAYDVLLVAIGANPVAAVPGAETFRGPADTETIRGILAEAVAGHVHRIAFVVPWGATWALPAYELALMTATHLRAHDVEGVELVLVTPEEEPLQLFGRAGKRRRPAPARGARDQGRHPGHGERIFLRGALALTRGPDSVRSRHRIASPAGAAPRRPAADARRLRPGRRARRACRGSRTSTPPATSRASR